MESEKEDALENVQEAPPQKVKVSTENNAPACATESEESTSWSEDPTNPLNWSSRLKWLHVLYVALMTFLVPLASSMLSPAITFIMVEFHNGNQSLAAFVVSVYVLGFALGPMVLAPLSEMYGRWSLYLLCDVIHIAFTVACAKAPSLGSLIAFRFLAGAFGGGPIAIGGGTVTDLFRDDEQAAPLGLYSLGAIAGPALGPVAGGYLSQAKGWRWIFWVLTIAAGAVAGFQCLFTKETYHPVILKRKSKELKTTFDRCVLPSGQPDGARWRKILTATLLRPIKMLIKSWIIAILCLICGIVYGYLYLLFTMMPIVFTQRYHFSVGSSGLVFLGICVGSLFAVPTFLAISAHQKKTRAANPSSESTAEDKLFGSIFSNLCIALGLLWFGWSAQRTVHWIVPILGTTFIGFGSILFFLPLVAYLLEAYSSYAASALAATTLLRSVGGASLPLAGRSMYLRLGVGWACSVLALVSLIFSPFPFLIYKYGTRIRGRERLRL